MEPVTKAADPLLDEIEALARIVQAARADIAALMGGGAYAEGSVQGAIRSLQAIDAEVGRMLLAFGPAPLPAIEIEIPAPPLRDAPAGA